MKQPLQYFKSCVDFRCGEPILEAQDTAREITLSTFKKNVDKSDLSCLSAYLSYQAHPRDGLTLRNDRHVRFYKGKLLGVPVYWMEHSRIEHFFAPESSIDELCAAT